MLGTLCVIDSQPRSFRSDELQRLTDLVRDRSLSEIKDCTSKRSANERESMRRSFASL